MSKAAELAALIGGQKALGDKNFIINGGFQVWQRGTTADTATTGDYMCDRFLVGFSGLDGNVDWDQETSTPDGHNYALKVSTDASESSLDAGDFLRVEQRFEGQNLQLLQKGTSSAKSVTLSFWVKSSVASTYTVALEDRDTSSFREISKSYVINSANTWEHKTVTFEGDTVGALDNDNAYSLGLYFWIDAGSTYTSGTFSTAWQARDTDERVYDTTGWLVSTSPQFYLTGIQLEVGDVATAFEHEDYGTPLRKCQRYYFRTNYNADNNYFGAGGVYSTTQAMVMLPLPVEMRAALTALDQSGTAAHYGSWGNGATQVCSAVPAIRGSSSKTTCAIDLTFSSLNSATGTYVYRIVDASGYLGVYAEL